MGGIAYIGFALFILHACAYMAMDYQKEDMEWDKRLADILKQLLCETAEAYVNLYHHFVIRDRIENGYALGADMILAFLSTKVILWLIFVLYDKIGLFFDKLHNRHNISNEDRWILKEKQKRIQIDRKFQERVNDPEKINVITEVDCAKLLKKEFPNMALLRNVNLYICDQDVLKSTECGIIGITEHAVYLFEVKNYSGYIFPSKDSCWMNVPYALHMNAKYTSSPIMQNNQHEHMLREIAKDKVLKLTIHKIVVFADRTMIIMPEQRGRYKIDDTYVCNVDEVEEIVKGLESTDKKIEREAIEDILRQYIQEPSAIKKASSQNARSFYGR